MTAKRRAKPTPLDQFAAFADRAGDALQAQLPRGKRPLAPEPEAVYRGAAAFVDGQWPETEKATTMLRNLVAAAARKADVPSDTASKFLEIYDDTVSHIANHYARAGFLMGMAHMAAWEASLKERQPRRRKPGRAKGGAR